MKCAGCGAENNMQTKYCHRCGNGFDSNDSFHYTKEHYAAEFMWKINGIDITPAASHDPLPILVSPPSQDQIDTNRSNNQIPLYRAAKAPPSTIQPIQHQFSNQPQKKRSRERLTLLIDSIGDCGFQFIIAGLGCWMIELFIFYDQIPATFLGILGLILMVAGVILCLRDDGYLG